MSFNLVVMVKSLSSHTPGGITTLSFQYQEQAENAYDALTGNKHANELIHVFRAYDPD